MANRTYRQTQMLLHVGSVFVGITLTLIFFLMGGGRGEVAQDLAVEEGGLNMSLPDPENLSIKENKMDAIVSEQERLRQERTYQAKQQNSSFDLMHSMQERTKESDKVAQVEAEVPELSLPEVVEPPTKRDKGSASRNKSASVRRSSQPVVRSDDERERQLARMEAEKRETRKRIMMAYGLQSEDEVVDGQEESTATPVEESKQTSSPKKTGFKTMGGAGMEGSSGAIRAVVHGEQRNVTTASQVKLRILDPITIDAVTIPRNTIIYGKASFSTNRLAIRTDNITYNDNVYPFHAEIYDMDGFQGLYIPDNVVDETKKDAGRSTINGTSVNVNGVTGLINTAANATINAVRSASSHKVSETKVTLPANYKLVIKKVK